jgi:fumarylacetoacetase
MLSHHTSNGCNLQAGDLFGSGTVSGAEKGTEACMTEITEAGRQPVAISDTESRGWLQAGDRITFKARAERDGYVGIGFGECMGTLKAPQ